MLSLDGLSLAGIKQDLFRNIVSLRASQDLFDDLSDDPADQQAAIELEMACKPGAFASSRPVIDRPFEEGDFFAAIRFPFDHWTASRFSRGQFGVWYGSAEFETTIHETCHHWRKGFLADAGWERKADVVIERRVHRVHCAAALIDLVRKAPDWPELVSDDYRFCQTLGEQVHHEGHPGLWTPSARCSGTNAAVFTPQVLSDPRPHCYLTYRTTGDGVEVYREQQECVFEIPDTV